jgi:hypothetical protein
MYNFVYIGKCHSIHIGSETTSFLKSRDSSDERHFSAPRKREQTQFLEMLPGRASTFFFHFLVLCNIYIVSYIS